jgi:ATP-dependent helicase/nuclease subunit A
MTSGRREFDPDQRAAIDVDRNAVVSAGAGSGKTTVLVERYARLVEQRGLTVDSILALTFTRKAAAEMNSRIYARLSGSAEPRSAEQLALFDTARISTLDSFCGSIARGAAHRYGIPPDFAVDEARLERAADEVAVELLMDRREDPALRRLVATWASTGCGAPSSPHWR